MEYPLESGGYTDGHTSKDHDFPLPEAISSTVQQRGVAPLPIPHHASVGAWVSTGPFLRRRHVDLTPMAVSCPDSILQPFSVFILVGNTFEVDQRE